MSTLAEIEQAAETLPAVEQQELLLFLAAKLRARGDALPEPRLFTPEQLQAWMDEDEADLRRFDAGHRDIVVVDYPASELAQEIAW